MIKNILFDLDGTLTDPSDGIINCIEYALEKLKLDIPERDSMRRFIGPPLWKSFQELLNTDSETEAQTAVNIYRERFSVIGMFENLPYNGIVPMLSSLRQSGYRMFVCTSKPEIFATKILAHFELDMYFEKIYGSSLDGTHVEKDSLIAHILSSEKLSPTDTAMIGDRIYDIDGADKNGLKAFGVSYGFGTAEEFASAYKVFDSPMEIEKFFRNNTDMSENAKRLSHL